jgi:hypothetical protein
LVSGFHLNNLRKKKALLPPTDELRRRPDSPARILRLITGRNL